MTLLGMVILLYSCGPAAESNTTESNPEETETVMEKGTIYFGTYTRKEGHVDGKASGIYQGTVDAESGSISLVDSIGDIINPSFVKVSNDGKILYAVSEVGEGELYSYEIGEKGKLTPLGKYPTSAPAPCHISVDGTDRIVMVANYMGGIVNVFLRGNDNQLTETEQLMLNQPADEKASHAHSATVSKDNRFVFIADLGKDKIWCYALNAGSGKLQAVALNDIALATGAGPRHFSFSPAGDYAYVINELNSTVTAFSYEASIGKLTEIQTISTLPDGHAGDNFCADLHIHPNGKYLYGSNRGHNSIVSYAIGDDGQLTLIGHTPTGGAFPRNFALSPEGGYLYAANQNSDNIVQFSIDAQTGALTRVGEFEVMTPVCIEFSKKK